MFGLTRNRKSRRSQSTKTKIKQIKINDKHYLSVVSSLLQLVPKLTKFLVIRQKVIPEKEQKERDDVFKRASERTPHKKDIENVLQCTATHC